MNSAVLNPKLSKVQVDLISMSVPAMPAAAGVTAAVGMATAAVVPTATVTGVTTAAMMTTRVVTSAVLAVMRRAGVVMTCGTLVAVFVRGDRRRALIGECRRHVRSPIGFTGRAAFLAGGGAEGLKVQLPRFVEGDVVRRAPSG